MNGFEVNSVIALEIVILTEYFFTYDSIAAAMILFKQS